MRRVPATRPVQWFIVAMVLAVGLAVLAVGRPTAAHAAGTTDYSNRARWLSLDTTGTAPVDIFYLYPTSYTATGTDPIICAVNNPQMIAGAKVAFARQATAFQPVGNVYAPYYRQADATMRAALTQPEQIQVVAGAPTRDAIAAFDYYIKHYNHGRPFILAGHSLGSNVTANLLSQYMGMNPAVRKRMIAAYVIGYSITPTYLAKNPFLKFANGASDTGVIVSWNTEGPVLVGVNPVTLPGGLAINPISWTRTEATATAAQNLGTELLDPTSQPAGQPIYNPDGSIKRYMNLCDARVDSARGVVVCSSIPEAVVTAFTGSFPKGVYHPFDYPFYYWNIRANAATRVTHFTAPTTLTRPAVSSSRPKHWRTATFTCFLTPSAAASRGTAKLLLYHRELKMVRTRGNGGWAWSSVKYWRLRATKVMKVTGKGRLSLKYTLRHSRRWKIVAKYYGSKWAAGSPGYARSTSSARYVTAR
jgi:pimeloyl-ACP methyl ester carboxylesterase